MAEPSQKPRPPGLVWVACGLMGFFAILVGSAVGVQLTAVVTLSDGHRLPVAFWFVLAIYVAAIVAYVAAAVGLYRRRAWARWTGIGLATLNLIIGLAVPLSHGRLPSLFGLAIQVGFLMILYRREVVEWVRPTGP